MTEAATKRLRKDFKNLQIYSKVGMQIFFQSANHKSVFSWAQHILQSQIRKFLWCASPLIANRKFAHFHGVSGRKSQICKFARQKAVFLIQIHISLPVNIYLFYLRKYEYILDYEIPCNSLSKLSQKAKVVLKFE